jgi:AcrR family transcriptional regulator
MSESAPSSRKPRHDKRRERNRRQLIDATLVLVSQGGRAGLSVSRISRAAGIDPPNFYAHFKGVEECEQAAADELDRYLARKLEPYERLCSSSGEQAVGSALADLLANWLEEPRWCTLMLNARYYPQSSIGQRMRRIVDRVRSDTRQHVADIASGFGLLDSMQIELDMLAELCLGHFMTVFEALVEGRLQDVPAAGLAIARANQATILAELERVGQDSAIREHWRARFGSPGRAWPLVANTSGVGHIEPVVLAPPERTPANRR